MSDATDRESAFDELARRAQPDTEPAISVIELEDILDRNKRAQRWTAGTTLLLNTIVMPTVRNGRVYRVTTEGVTGTAEPSWPDENEAEVTSGGAELVEDGPDFGNVYDIRAACQEIAVLRRTKAVEYHKDGEEVIFKQADEVVNSLAMPLIG